MNAVRIYANPMQTAIIGNNFCMNGCNSTTNIRLFYVETVGDNFCMNGCNSTVSLDISGVQTVGTNFCENGCWSLSTIVINQYTNINVLAGVKDTVRVVCADAPSFVTCQTAAVTNPFLNCVSA